MSTLPYRLDDAYEAIRAHHHERPYADDPSRIYADLGSLSALLAGLEQLAQSIGAAAQQATGADDGEMVHRLDVAAWMDSVRSALATARYAAEDAHVHASHLIFEVASHSAGE